LPDGEVPAGADRIDGVVMDEEAIERHLLEVVTPNRFAGAMDPDDDFRVSLAGAQEKDAFLWWDGQWDEAARRDAHHAHLQAATGRGRWSAGGLQHLGGQRVALPSPVGRLRPACGASPHHHVRQAAGARR
jgi:hypothetical protein